MKEQNIYYYIETERLKLREMTESDLPALAKILQDPEVMYAYEHAFSDEEVREWFDRQVKRYELYEHRYGLWAVILKETGEMIGQCGLTLQDTEEGQVLEVGYLFQKAFWHQGYATEAASACKRYAFDVLGAEEVCSIIRDNNIASQNVARRNGMTVRSRYVKHYYGVEMPHLVFAVRKQEITYETLKVSDARDFWNMMNQLDWETDYMMYEPGEREEKTRDLSRLEQNIKYAEEGGFLLAAKDGANIIGYLWADRGGLNRTAHTAYIVVGIRKAYQGRGIGTELFRRLDIWAEEQGLVRLELTVECPNEAAVHLYEKCGFQIEGIRKSSMLVNGIYVDEYYMGKILPKKHNKSSGGK